MIPEKLRMELAGLDLQVKLNDYEIYVKDEVYSIDKDWHLW